MSLTRKILKNKNKIVSGVVGLSMLATPLAGFAAEGGDRTAAENFVNRIYTKALERPADPEGEKYWVDRLLGITEPILAADMVDHIFVGAPEFQNMNKTDAELIEVFYQTFHNRSTAGDAEGAEFWEEQLHKSSKRAVVAGILDAGSEFQNFCDAAGIDRGRIVLTKKDVDDPYNPAPWVDKLNVDSVSAITENIEVENGTPLEDVIKLLPAEVEITLSDESINKVPVVWGSNTYDAQTAGTYSFTGTLDLSALENVRATELTATANVVVAAGAPLAVELSREAGITPGMELLMVTLNNVEDPSQYDVHFGTTKFTYANGKFAAEVPAGTEASDLTITEKQAPVMPVAVELSREAGITPGMELLMVTLNNVEDPSQYDVYFETTKFTYANSKFAAEVPAGTAITALNIIKK